MAKKQYIVPCIDGVICFAECETGLNSGSHDTETDPVAPDQKDVDPDEPEVNDGPETPPTNWDW